MARLVGVEQVVNYRDHQQRKDGRGQQSEDQRPRHPREDGVCGNGQSLSRTDVDDNGHANQVCQALRPHLLHNLCTVTFDGFYADA